MNRSQDDLESDAKVRGSLNRVMQGQWMYSPVGCGLLAVGSRFTVDEIVRSDIPLSRTRRSCSSGDAVLALVLLVVDYMTSRIKVREVSDMKREARKRIISSRAADRCTSRASR